MLLKYLNRQHNSAIKLYLTYKTLEVRAAGISTDIQQTVKLSIDRKERRNSKVVNINKLRCDTYSVTNSSDQWRFKQIQEALRCCN